MYIVVLLIHPRKGLTVFAARSQSRIIHFFVPKNLNIIYSKNTQTTPQIYCNAVSIEKFTQLPSEIYIFYYHSTADYELVPDSLDRLSVFCVCSLITGFLICMLVSGELCIPWRETNPGIPGGGWVTVVMPEPLDSVTPGIVLCVCNPRIGCPIIPCEERYPGVPNRGGTVELVYPLKQCGSPAIVLWVCNPYSEGSGIPWRGGSSLEGARLSFKSCAVLTGTPTNTGSNEEK